MGVNYLLKTSDQDMKFEVGVNNSMSDKYIMIIREGSAGSNYGHYVHCTF